MDTPVNRRSQAISNTPGTSGNFVLGSAAAGYAALGASHDGLSFAVLAKEGSIWEVRTGCTYTHSSTTLSRGTLEESSSGSAVAFTSAATVSVIRTAAQDAQLAAVATVGGVSVSQPSSFPTAAAGSAGALTGTYYYTATFYTATGETDINTAAPTPVTVTSQRVNLSSIPVSSSPLVIGRRIYRNAAVHGDGNNFSKQRLVAEIADNTTTTYTDNLADASLGVYVPRISSLKDFIAINGARVLNLNGITNGIGQNVLASGTGYACTAIGTNSQQFNAGGSRNTSIGVFALQKCTTGDQNTAIGTHALNEALTTSNSTAIGYACGINFVGTGTQYMTGVGCFSLNALTTGSGNTAIGYNSLVTATTGYNNTAIGEAAGSGITDGAGNSLVGLYAGQTLNSNFNVAMGMQALTSSAVGGANTALGVQAGAATTGGNGVFIGFQAGQHETAGNAFYVDSYGRSDLADQKAKALLYGTFASTAAAQQLTINAPVKMLTTTVSGLPAASSFTNYSCRVTDANAPTLGSTVSGGGSVRCMVTSDGTNWKVG